jgi:curli biogenesis system outer membrane secretion channel CsgG
MKKVIVLFSIFAICLGASAQRKVEVVEPTVQAAQDDGMVLKRKVAIGRFTNETQYAKGIFYDRENDPMGKQALDILSSKLASSGKFLLLERSDLATLLEECQKGGTSASVIGADYMIIGSITEFGRKDTGKSGVFSSQKTQTVEAAVSIRLVDVSTGLIIYSDEAKGSAELRQRPQWVWAGKQVMMQPLATRPSLRLLANWWRTSSTNARTVRGRPTSFLATVMPRSLLAATAKVSKRAWYSIS